MGENVSQGNRSGSGRAGQRDGRTAGQRDSGRAGERDSRTAGRRESGTAGERESRTAGEQDGRTVGQRESRTAGRQEVGDKQRSASCFSILSSRITVATEPRRAAATGPGELDMQDLNSTGRYKTGTINIKPASKGLSNQRFRPMFQFTRLPVPSRKEGDLHPAQ